MLLKTDKERLEEKILKTAGCWFWMGATEHSGQSKTLAARFKYKGKVKNARKVAWEIYNEQELPEGFHVALSCMEKLCVNPAHMEIERDGFSIAGRYGRRI